MKVFLLDLFITATLKKIKPSFNFFLSAFTKKKKKK